MKLGLNYITSLVFSACVISTGVQAKSIEFTASLATPVLKAGIGEMGTLAEVVEIAEVYEDGIWTLKQGE